MEDESMLVDVAPATMPDSRPLYRLISKTRRLLRASWVFTGLCLTIGLALGALVLTSLIDIAIPIWPTTRLEIPIWWGVTLTIPHIATALRVTALILVVAPAGWAFMVGVVGPLFRRLSAENVARRIEAHLPGIHNRLVSAIDLDSRQKRGPMSSVFYRKLLTEALDRIGCFRPHTALDTGSMKRAGLTAMGSILALVLLGILFHGSLSTAMARIFQPFADIPPASSVAYDVKPANADVLSKELVTFAAEVAHGQPHKLWLQVYAGKGNDRKLFDLSPDKNKPSLWTCTIDCDSLADGLKEGFKYRILGGGTWSPEYQIKVVERPEITGIRTFVHYPPYMSLPQRKETTTQDNKKVTGPEEAQVELEVQVRGQVATGELQVGQLGRTPIPVEDQSERIWFTKELPPGIMPDGAWNWETKQGQTFHTEPAAFGTHGHWFQNDPLGHKVEVGEALFVDAYIVPGQEPEAIMLQWHDGASWDHGAVWGADRIREGAAGTESKRLMGSLPAAGKWVRLKAPARELGLEDKVVRGMAFKLHGGQVYWKASGSMRIEKEGLLTERTFPMTLKEEGVWTGKFPLEIRRKLTDKALADLRKDNVPEGVLAKLKTLKDQEIERRQFEKDLARMLSKGEQELFQGLVMKHAAVVDQGLFRTELRSERGHANKNMDEIRYKVEIDQPPAFVQVLPGVNTTLTKPQPLPLSITVMDDYSLEDVSMIIQRGVGASLLETRVGNGEERHVLQQFEQPETTPRPLITYLKQSSQLRAGEEIRYAIEARDRKGQKTRTAFFTVKISDEPAAADKQLTEFEKSHDPFREKYLQLIGEQKKVQEKLEKMSGQYAELIAKREAFNKETLAGNLETKVDPKTGQKEPEPAPKLDPELAKKLAELQKELAALSKDEDKNAKTADQLNTELAKMTEQANQLQMLPRPIAEQMQQTQKTFEQMVAQAMKDMTAQTTQAADPKQGLPDLKGMKDKADRVGKEMEGIKNRLDALAKARQEMRDELAKALRDLQKQLLNEVGGLTERELKDLQDYLAKLREDMKILQQRQQNLADKTDKADANDVAKTEKNQMDLDKDLEKLLADARKVLAAKKRKPRGDDPEFPEAPYTPDGKEVKVPPKEKDTDEPLPGQKDKKNPMNGDKTGDPMKKDDLDKEEPLFMPNLGGEKPVLDKRFDKKDRPVKPKPGDKDNPNDPDARKADLQDKQNQRMQDLDSAMKSLGSDQDTLGKMMDALQQAMKGNKGQKGKPQEGKPQPGEPNEADSAMDQLAQMLQSPKMQQAMAMAQRMRQGQPGQPGQQSQPGQPQPNSGTTGNLQGGPVANNPLQGDLSKFDPATRAVLLKLPPRLREEIRQGMEEKGPEAYKAFIEDYFNRLTKIKEPGKP
jgi:hypothetical protein